MPLRIFKISTLATVSVLSLSAAAWAITPQADGLSGQFRSTPVLVNTDNFVRAETAAQFDRMNVIAGGVSKMTHFRDPTPLDQQSVIRMRHFGR